MKNKQTWLVSLIILMGMLLRIWNFWLFPVVGETQDEVAWIKAGHSLLTKGVPISWSHFGGYDNNVKVVSTRGEFNIVQPWLDHPPVFALLAGLPETFFGKGDELPSLKLGRVVAIGIAFVNLVLFFFATKSHFTSSHRLWSLALFALLPPLVWLQRMVMAEQLLVTWMLAIWFTLDLKNTKLRFWLLFLFAALLPLTKVTGIAIAAGYLAYGIAIKNKSYWQPLLFGMISGVAMWLAYAAYFDWNLFWSIQSQQGARDVGMLTLFSAFWWPQTLVAKTVTDPWWLLGWVALVYAWASSSAKEKEWKLRAGIVILAMLGMHLMSVGENTVHGWYRLPYWPFLSMGIAFVLDQAISSRKWIWWAITVLLLLPAWRLGLMTFFGHDWLFSHQALLARIAGVVIMVGVAAELWSSRSPRWLWYISWVTIISITLAAFISSARLTEVPYWRDDSYLINRVRT